ncbi:serine--tRNA ligase [Hoeflea prorocentri]|uniref:Serine--tRNA ligase n=1 Tax=Hoeflea prorocentri TaxID=1922333 RepID=A0A9X3UH51_9HYPH|nr:serine--tRNA ligase [Hoeflea prorocentri]MCY6380587.1 serine--tRNA ligase [Hoeflea prorocentri]MDA5398387.1 serine--tRNA ligase [Hoeflea prorocentri]
MLDIKWIRENAAALDAALAKRDAAAVSAEIIRIDEERRERVQKLQDMQSRRNAASKEIGAAMGRKDQETADRLKAEVAELKSALQSAEEEVRALDSRLEVALSTIPNMPLDDVPEGADEDDNVEVRKVGTKPGWNHKAIEHFEIGEALGQMDFELASRIAGSRFVVLRGQLARLERALGQFMLDMHTGEHGYTEVQPPLLVRDEAVFGTGQLPKFAEDLFHTTDGRWLIPTAEVSLTNLVREEIFDHDRLPLRFTALTPCFRSEAGSAGRDTRGMLRQHQFNKVELVSITDPESSLDELERMTSCAEEVLKRLGLHYRVVVLCTGDMGFGARKTYDIEAWLPGQDTYREISSCSVCGDFQARRMNARFRRSGEKGVQFVHTLNGSGVAVGRALIAIMENYLNEDGSVSVPDALLPYMGGITRIERAD